MCTTSSCLVLVLHVIGCESDAHENQCDSRLLLTPLNLKIALKEALYQLWFPFSCGIKKIAEE